MKTQLPSLITSNPAAGMVLAGQLAEQLRAQQEQTLSTMERPGGMNDLLPPQISAEMVGSILFYAIAAANNGWATTA
jgi:hypothetical protein